MKRYYIILILIALTIGVQAQNTTPRVSRGGDRNVQQPGTNTAKKTSELSVRAQMMNEQLTQEIGNARWIRYILRELDLTNEKNAPLYFPVQEMNGMKNLFTSLFQLLSEGKIKVYGYQADYESFEDDNIMSFKDILDKNNIYYDEVPGGDGRTRYVVNAGDIPSREANKLYVKEAWYFDQNNSLYDVKTLAICPIAFITMETGEELPQALFWVKYEDIRPYIKNNYIMTSSINNAKTYTMDDFFRRRMYAGDIIQTENLLNLPLAMLFDEEELPLEQQRIEEQLKSFNDSLWIPADTTTAVLSKRESRKVTAARSSGNASASKEKAPKQTKPPAEKAPRQPKAPTEKATKSAPTRSIRR